MEADFEPDEVDEDKELSENQTRFLALADIVNHFKSHPEVKRALRRKMSTQRLNGRGVDHILGAHVRMSGVYDLLNADDEQLLFRSIQEGILLYGELERLDNLTDDQEQTFIEATVAQQTMLLANMRLAINVSKPYWKTIGIEDVDIIQEANLGLIRAIALFDHMKGFKFSTYAVNWISSAARRAVSDKSRLIRLPVHRHDLYLRTIRIVKQATVKSTTGELTREEIEAVTGMAFDDYAELVRQGVSHISSLDAPIDTNGSLLGDFMAGNQLPIEEIAWRNERKTMLGNLLADSKLNVNQRFIIGLRSGLEPQYFPGLEVIKKDGTVVTYEEAARLMPTTDGLTLDDIGNLMQLTRERVRQIEVKAFAALRAHSYRYQPDEENSGEL